MIEIVCLIIGADAVILCGAWFIINHVTKSEIKGYRLSQIENTIKELPCKDYSKAISDQNRNISELKNLAKENNDLLKKLSKRAMEMEGKSYSIQSKVFNAIPRI